MPATRAVSQMRKRDNSDWKWCAGREMMMAVEGDKAYVTGGWVLDEHVDSSKGINIFSNPDLFVFDFSKDTDINTSVAPFMERRPLPLDTVPAMKWGSFWPLSSSKLLLSQGELEYYRLVDTDNHNSTLKTARKPAGGRLFEYSIADDTWSVLPKPSTLTNSVSKIATTFSKKANKGFFLGGQIWNNAYLDKGETRVGVGATSGPNPVGNSFQDRFVTFDAEGGGWKNETSGIPHNEFATLTSLEDASEEGMLVLLGGQTGADGHISGDKDGPSWRTLENVQIYDIASQKWYNQPTTASGGFFPPSRILHCAVAATAPDGSSHNIYLIGGQSEDNKSFLRDVWVLSLPSFHWIPLKADLPTGLSDMACGKVGGKYLFTFGGTDSTFPQTCDGASDGRGGPGRLLDLTTGRWGTEFKKGAYTVPKAVYDEIGGDAEGGATFVEPKKGFADDALKEVLKIKAVVPPSDGGNDGGSSSGGSSGGGTVKPPAETDKGSSSGLSGGAIGGIVVGVVAVIALIGVVLFLMKRKKKQAGGTPSQTGLNELAGGNTEPAEYYTYKAPGTMTGTGTEYSDQPVEKDSVVVDPRVELDSTAGRQYYEMDSTSSAAETRR